MARRTTRGRGTRPADDGRRVEDGAAAVEFALVATIFFLILFGIIQYGLYFNDALNTRQGVREAVRQGVVRNFAGGSGATDMAKLRDLTAKEVGAITGATYVKVVVPAGGWEKAKPLTVCAMVRSDGAIGLLPMPGGGWIRSKTQMSIEQAAAPVPTGSTSSDALPAGADWGWCS